MKKVTLILFMALASFPFMQAQSWTTTTYGLYLNPTTANVGIGSSPSSDAKLYLYNFMSSTSNIYGLYSYTGNTSTTAPPVYGSYVYGYSANTAYGAIYGVYSVVSGGNANSRYSGYFNGGKFAVMGGNLGVGTDNPNTLLEVGTTLGLSVSAKNLNLGSTDLTFLKNTGRLLLGWNRSGSLGEQNLVSNRGGGSNGGFAFYDYDNNGVMTHLMTIDGATGNVGIGVINPAYVLDIASSSANSIRIGKIGYTGNLGVPLNAVTAQFNIDFTGYRDININQIGARIAAIRINNHLPRSALVQKTGLAFYTNPTGMNAGTTDLVERMRINPDGNVGIGTINPTVKLDVIGTIRAEEVKVCLNQGCDFVFDKDYKLMSIKDLSRFVAENKHLPEVAPAAQMESEGINLSEMNAKLLQKVEELTLYIIDLQKQIDELKK